MPCAVQIAAALLALGAAAGLFAQNRDPKTQPTGIAQRAVAVLTGHDDEASREECLANVKQVAMAVQMYLTDYDRFPPEESRPEVIEYFSHKGPGMAGCKNAQQANPYLRWPVILDEYVKERSVWTCPSARLSGGAGWIIGASDWFEYERKHEAEWGASRPGAEKKGALGGPCQSAWPPGWGGSVTDSIAQRLLAAPAGRPNSTDAFRQDIGHTATFGMAASAVADATWFVVCGDSNSAMFSVPMSVAYADGCRIRCGADWTNCPNSQECGASVAEAEQAKTRRSVLKKYTRHNGGSNLGFMDGHAKWFTAGQILANSPGYGDPNRGRLRGVGCGPGCDEPSEARQRPSDIVPGVE
jgi:prepilin-type processing-associated H-X9-DG protein